MSLTIVLGAVVAQDRPVFEVASIRSGKPGTNPSLFQAENGALRVANYSVRLLVQMAWNVREFQVLDIPDWATSVGFDISAKGNPAATDSQLRAMIQALLADRFQLQAHSETRELPIYALVVDRKGHKLSPGTDPSPPGLNSGPGYVVAQKVSLLNLARVLASRVDRPIVDRTGLMGRFDFALEWAPDQIGNAVAPDTSAPSLFTAIQEQLGLKLEATRGPVDVLVIDSVERPTPD